LAEILNNTNFPLVCKTVKSFNKDQTFYLTSEAFNQIPNDLFDSLNDFQIQFKDCKFDCNKLYASLISKRIFRRISDLPNNSFIDFCNCPNSELIKVFFEILRGRKILIKESNILQISETICFREFDSYYIHDITKYFTFDFTSNDIFSLSSHSVDTIQTIFSSVFIRFKNEGQIFSFIHSLIKKDRNNLKALKYILFGLIDFFLILADYSIHSNFMNSALVCLIL
jgi:hypothetical protein